jgi:Ca2+-binding EF-hand superfamily protein
MSRPKEELVKAFEHFDADDNGSIDREEFGDLMDSLGADASSAELDIGFSEIDTDSSGEIEQDEFVEWWQSR